MTVPSESPLYLDSDLDLNKRTQLAIEALNKYQDEKKKQKRYQTFDQKLMASIFIHPDFNKQASSNFDSVEPQKKETTLTPMLEEKPLLPDKNQSKNAETLQHITSSKKIV